MDVVTTEEIKLKNPIFCQLGCADNHNLGVYAAAERSKLKVNDFQDQWSV